MAGVVRELAAIEDDAEHRAARARIREEALRFRLQARRLQIAARLADAGAKFGGGSLLTATLLLIVTGKADVLVLWTAALALLLFVAATTWWSRCELRATQREFEADWLDGLLKEIAHER